jgi:hypothetical protein
VLVVALTFLEPWLMSIPVNSVVAPSKDNAVPARSRDGSEEFLRRRNEDINLALRFGSSHIAIRS